MKSSGSSAAISCFHFFEIIKTINIFFCNFSTKQTAKDVFQFFVCTDSDSDLQLVSPLRCAIHSAYPQTVNQPQVKPLCASICRLASHIPIRCNPIHFKIENEKKKNRKKIHLYISPLALSMYQLLFQIEN